MVWPFGALRTGFQLRKEPGQRTARNALIAALLLVAVLTVASQGCSGSWTTTHAMERYVKLGPRLGPADLERELLAAYPAGSSIAPLFAYFDRQGFDCRAALEAGRNGECRYRARRDDGRVATMHVAVAHDGLVLAALSARMSIGAP